MAFTCADSASERKQKKWGLRSIPREAEKYVK